MRKVITLFALLAPAIFGLDTSKLKPTGYVNDFAHVLDGGSHQRLESYAANLERTTGVQMAVVTVDSLEDDPIEDVANKLYREWGIGKKGKDEGILFLLAIKDRKQRAEIGYGLEPIVNDAYVGGVLRGIRPILRQGNYGAGLLAAAQQVGSHIAQAKGVELGDAPRERRSRQASRGGGSIPWPLLIIGFFFVLWLIGRMSGGGGGGGSGFLTGMILGNLMGRSSGGWGGGGFGGSGSGGDGGGGFGGFGGGDSGGGGSSSDW